MRSIQKNIVSRCLTKSRPVTQTAATTSTYSESLRATRSDVFTSL